MKVTKLVIGILMIIFSLFILFQSVAAGFVNTIENKGNTSGSAGVLLAIGYLAAGIIYLATRNRNGLGGDIANVIILGILGIIGLANSDNVYQDLLVWIFLGLIIGIGFFAWHLLLNRKINQNQINNVSRGFANDGTLPTRAQYRSQRKH
ncbi:hypothetical protein [Companilactobacillus sp. HBUAS59544]|uniref:hypothetical protein n=1 Tax=Companilactobacillus sp. HBUAS59544 TaxID=3109363 RepID=UPI002FF36AF7